MIAVLVPVAAAQDPPPDFRYRFDIRNPVRFDANIVVDNEYELWTSEFAYEVEGEQRFPDGSTRVKVKLLYWKFSDLTADGKTTFDSHDKEIRGEEGDLTLLREVANKVFMTCDIAGDGSISRVILAEGPYTAIKREGSWAIEAARDGILGSLPLGSGKPAKTGETWEEERNPCGFKLPFTFRYRFKVNSVNPKTGMITFGLDGDPAFGRTLKPVLKQEMTLTMASGTFDGKEGKLVSYELKGGFKATFGKEDQPQDYTYTYSARISVR